MAAAVLSAPMVMAQKPGDPVTPEVFSKVDWIQGEAPASWEPGKLYILECWATWCGPCIAAIPHVDALYDRYKEQGLRVIGMNVFEDGREKVADFVKKKGDGMSYPVSYTGRGGAFETAWLQPAGVRGIPTAFLVKDGKVLGLTHPAGLTDEVVEKLLKGGEETDALLEKMNARTAKQGELLTARQAWSAAAKAGDVGAMKAALARIEELEPKDYLLPLMRNEILVASGDWAGLETFLAGAEDDPAMRKLILSELANKVSGSEKAPASTISALLSAYEKVLATGKKTFVDSMALARLQWRTGDRVKAAAEARDGVELSTSASEKVKSAVKKFSSAVEGGEMPTREQYGEWIKSGE